MQRRPLKCDQCGRRLAQSRDGHLAFRTDGPLMVKSDGTIQSKCFFCKTPFTLPMDLHKSWIREDFVLDLDGKAGSGKVPS